MTVYVGLLVIASVKIAIYVSSQPDSQYPAAQEWAETQVDMYRRVFTSYSHLDTAIVRACAVGLQAIGYDVMLDVDVLRAGELWSTRLEQLIDDANIFQLFWSKNAANSQQVEREWRYALQRSMSKNQGQVKGAGFIRPVSWQEPIPEIPYELSHLHFKLIEPPPLSQPAGSYS
jgi:hypothetical protein